MKYSRFQGVLRWSGGTIMLRKGQTVDDDHPLVAERPELFDDGASDQGASISTSGPSIERATRAPGEVRNTPGTGPRREGGRVPKQTDGGSTQ